MIEEDYVSFETAKLLKDKGFNGVCRYYYPDSHTQLISYVDCKQSDMFGPEACIAPTLQMAMKWLREEKNIFVDVYYEEDVKGYMYSIIKLPKGTPLNVSDLADNSYEEACEVAIKYCLEKLI